MCSTVGFKDEKKYFAIWGYFMQTGSEGLVCKNALTWLEVIWNWVKYSVHWKLYCQRQLSTSSIKDFSLQCKDYYRLTMPPYTMVVSNSLGLKQCRGRNSSFSCRFGIWWVTVSSQGLLQLVSSQIMMEQH